MISTLTDEAVRHIMGALPPTPRGLPHWGPVNDKQKGRPGGLTHPIIQESLTMVLRSLLSVALSPK